MNSSFNGSLQIAWDSTSLSAFKECPRKYYYSIVRGFEPRQRSFHLTFGILYHEALEAYDRARASGSSHDAAVCAGVYRALKNSWNRDLNRPWASNDSYKNRFTLIRTVVWYFEHFANDPIETVLLSSGAPAVELSFRFEFPYEFRTTEGSAIFCGHLDRLGEISSQTWVVDRKSTKHAIDDNYFKRYSPDNQMSGYSFAGKIVYNVPVQGVIIDAAQVLVNSSRFQRGFANRTSSQLDEWVHDTALTMSHAEDYAKEGYWPQNDKSCFNYGGCPFQMICSRAPEVREEFLNDSTKYQKRIWDPLVIRGDV